MNSKLKGLIISDNPQLSQFAIEISSTHNLLLDLAYTRSSRTGIEMESLGARKIDVTSKNFIDSAIAKYDYILSIHCQQIFPSKLFQTVSCFNLHPGLNPNNRGWYPQVFSILNNLPTGATLHRLSSKIDGGPVITQIQVPFFSTDTSKEIYDRITTAEKEILTEMLPKLSSPTYQVEEVEIRDGNYNSKDDFKKLCNLDLNSRGTLKEHIDLLRALTHGSFKNAYFKDENGNRVYVSINLQKE